MINLRLWTGLGTPLWQLKWKKERKLHHKNSRSKLSKRIYWVFMMSRTKRCFQTRTTTKSSISTHLASLSLSSKIIQLKKQILSWISNQQRTRNSSLILVKDTTTMLPLHQWLLKELERRNWTHSQISMRTRTKTWTVTSNWNKVMILINYSNDISYRTIEEV